MVKFYYGIYDVVYYELTSKDNSLGQVYNYILKWN